MALLRYARPQSRTDRIIGAPPNATPEFHNLIRRLGPLVLALLVGVSGALLFRWLQLPLPWMLGSMCACLTAALIRLPIAAPGRLRPPMVVVLGVLLGSAFTWEVLERATAWWLSLTLLIPYSVLIGLIGIPYLMRFAGLDRTTAYFAAMPAGLQEMVIVGRAMGGDDRKIALIHGARILLVVLSLPLLFQWLADVEVGGGPGAATPLLAEAPVELLILTLCGVLGWQLGLRLRLPAALMFGPMIVSAAAHLAGISESKPPDEIVALAQLVTGTVVGCRFVGVPLHIVVITVLHALGLVLIMLAVATGFALLLAPLLDTSFAAVVLAYAPGGVVEMGLVALALGLEVAFVATHHIARIVIIMAGAPFVFRLLDKRR